MEFKFGFLLIMSSFVLLTSPLALCHTAPAPSPIPVSYISEAPAYIPDANAPTSYISDVPASAPAPSLSPDFSPTPSPSSSSTPDSLNTLDSKVEKPLNAVDRVEFTAIKEICDVTEHPVLCAKSVLPYIKGAINPTSALKTEITTFSQLLEKALALLKAFDNDPSTSSSSALKVCIDVYHSAQADLKQALGAIDSNDKVLLKSLLSGAITDLGTCDDTFAESSGDEMPLDSDLVSTLRMLATICMDIAAVLLI